ncbi:MAG: hypothetical protein PVF27_00025 [Gemmatimonadales bacterium]|jgi:hypothetical protein
MRHLWTRTLWASAALLLVAGIATTAAAQELVPGQVMTSSTAGDEAATFTFIANDAGVLTVVVRATGDADLVLEATDADGQQLPEGRSDQDLGGDRGAEQLAVTLPRAGTYQVQVDRFGFDDAPAEFRIGASWLPFPELEIAPDPDGTPSTATRLAPEQQSINESINGSRGDYWDWFVITADTPGTITLITRAEDGDLVLEAYEEGEFDDYFERSDQDLQGSGGNEALTLSIDAGQTFYFKVRPWSEGATVSYRLQVGFIPG